MKQRGRPSSAALSVVPISSALDRVPRQPPPADLTEDEAEIWVFVVNSEPADWFTASTVPLLAQYCRHVVQCRVVARMVQKAAADDSVTVAEYDRLLAMQERESRAIGALARAMRLTHQSTVTNRGNKKPAARKLWEG